MALVCTFQDGVYDRRALNGRVPTDDRVAKFGYNLQAGCFCCSPPVDELETSRKACPNSMEKVRKPFWHISGWPAT